MLKKHTILYIVIIAIFFIVILVFFAQNKDTNQTEALPAEENDIEQISDWQIYRNEEYKFEVKYPRGWETWAYKKDGLSQIIFGPSGSRSGGGIWGIVIYPAEQNIDSQIDSLVLQIGRQFSDRKEIKEELYIDNYKAKKIIVTTDSHTDWFSETVILYNDKNVFLLSNGGIKNKEFSNFYDFFKIIGSE